MQCYECSVMNAIKWMQCMECDGMTVENKM